MNEASSVSSGASGAPGSRRYGGDSSAHGVGSLGSNMSVSRRARKNKREKERRMEVADKFEELTHLVGLPDRAKANKVNVLAEAIRVIQVCAAAAARGRRLSPANLLSQHPAAQALRKMNGELEQERSDLRNEITNLTMCLMNVFPRGHSAAGTGSSAAAAAVAAPATKAQDQQHLPPKKASRTSARRTAREAATQPPQPATSDYSTPLQRFLGAPAAAPAPKRRPDAASIITSSFIAPPAPAPLHHEFGVAGSFDSGMGGFDSGLFLGMDGPNATVSFDDHRVGSPPLGSASMTPLPPHDFGLGGMEPHSDYRDPAPAPPPPAPLSASLGAGADPHPGAAAPPPPPPAAASATHTSQRVHNGSTSSSAGTTPQMAASVDMHASAPPAPPARLAPSDPGTMPHAAGQVWPAPSIVASRGAPKASAPLPTVPSAAPPLGHQDTPDFDDIIVPKHEDGILDTDLLTHTHCA